MPRPKGSKNKPKTGVSAKKAPAKKAAPAKKTTAKKPKVTTLGTPAVPVAKTVVEEARYLPKTVAEQERWKAAGVSIKGIDGDEVVSVAKKVEGAFVKKPKAQPSTPVNAPELAPEEPKAQSAKTQAVAGKNEGEAVIRPVDDEDGADTGSHVVIQGGKAVLRKNSGNPELD